MIIAKNINNLLSQRVADLESRCWANPQYLRRKCQGTVDILRSVDGNSLQEKLFKFSKKMVATFILVRLKCVIVLSKEMTELW